MLLYIIKCVPPVDMWLSMSNAEYSSVNLVIFVLCSSMISKYPEIMKVTEMQLYFQ